MLTGSSGARPSQHCRLPVERSSHPGEAGCGSCGMSVVTRRTRRGTCSSGRVQRAGAIPVAVQPHLQSNTSASDSQPSARARRATSGLASGSAAGPVGVAPPPGVRSPLTTPDSRQLFCNPWLDGERNPQSHRRPLRRLLTVRKKDDCAHGWAATNYALLRQHELVAR